jgi:hypothetical protein
MSVPDAPPDAPTDLPSEAPLSSSAPKAKITPKQVSAKPILREEKSLLDSLKENPRFHKQRDKADAASSSAGSSVEKAEAGKTVEAVKTADSTKKAENPEPVPEDPNALFDISKFDETKIMNDFKEFFRIKAEEIMRLPDPPRSRFELADVEEKSGDVLGQPSAKPATMMRR